jgi:hypothetical protein
MDCAFHLVELAPHVRKRHMPDGKGRAGMIGINVPFGHISSFASPPVTILHG